MFKRVAKRQRKREEEEELGLDEEMKQVLGLQDTDSDESLDSSSDSESGNDSDLDSQSGDEGTDGDVQSVSLKRKRTARAVHFQSDSNDSLGEEDLSGLDVPETESTEEDLEDDESPPMGVIAATTNPIYDVPGAPPSQDLRACVICPGKLLKSTKMTNVHVQSTAHLRRLQRYTDHVSKLVSAPEGLTTEDPREILRDILGVKTPEVRSPDASSKRSQRKALWKAKQVERKKACKQAKATTKSGSEEEPAVDGVVEKQPKDGRAKKSDMEKKKKKAGGVDDIPVSIAVDLPAAPNRRERRKSGAERREHDSDATALSRPAKRQKRDSEVCPNTSLLVDDRTAFGVLAKPISQEVDVQSHGGKRAKSGPKLKRHNTSLYFADDEKLPPTPAKPHPQPPTASKYTVTDKRADRKNATLASDKGRRPTSRNDRDGETGSQGQKPKRRAKEANDKGMPPGGQKSQGGRPLYRAQGNGKGLSAEQFGGGQVLQIHD